MKNDAWAEHERVTTFVKEHREKVSQIVNERYSIRFKETYNTAKQISDFALYVGAPLLLVALTWMYTSHETSKLLIVAIVAAAGLAIHWYRKHLVKLCCREMFRKEKADLIAEYVDKLLNEEVQKNPEQKDALVNFYQKCYSELLQLEIDINPKIK